MGYKRKIKPKDEDKIKNKIENKLIFETKNNKVKAIRKVRNVSNYKKNK